MNFQGVRDICHSYNAFWRENIDNMTIGGEIKGKKKLFKNAKWKGQKWAFVHDIK